MKNVSVSISASANQFGAFSLKGIVHQKNEYKLSYTHFVFKLFPIVMTNFHMWNTKDDVLKNVHEAFFSPYKKKRLLSCINVLKKKKNLNCTSAYSNMTC